MLAFPLGQLLAQSALLPYDEDDYWMIRRLEIKSGAFSPYFHSSVAPISRQDLARYADSFKIQGNPITFKDFLNLKYIQVDNPAWSNPEAGKRKAFLNYFYPQRSALFYQEGKNFAVSVNPILYLQAGNDFTRKESLYRNTRGFEVRGHIGKKVGFYTYLTENQLRPPYYLQQFSAYVGNYPSAGLTKAFKGNAYDFFQGRGYITFSPVKDLIRIQFGHDRNFIGDGYRSFILSDFGKEYLFLKVNTKVWKFNYQNLFAQMIDRERVGEDGLIRKKYVVMHHLSYNILKNLNVGVFETIVFDRSDSLGNNGYFDINYLNPVIFYRSVEHGLNSSDNAMVGMNARWDFLKHFSLYGQLTLDEFVLDEYRNNRGWWANKYAAQIGLKIIDPGIPNLELQFEYNSARPYTFMHFKRSQNYTHYQTPLGHPLGANFNEGIAILRYRPLKSLQLSFTYINYQKGLDNDTSNWGGDIMQKTYLDYEKEYGNKTGQGEITLVQVFEARASWQVAHRVFLEASYLFRDSRSHLKSYSGTSSILNLGLRMNIARPRNLF